MAEIIKTFTQSQPAACFIGKAFSPKLWKTPPEMWGTFFANGWFALIEEKLPADWDRIFPDGSAYIGLERGDDRGMNAYWVGMFAPTDAEVPEGFEKLPFPAAEIAAAYVYGREDGDLYGNEEKCLACLAQDGLAPKKDAEGRFWVWERYACPRFTEPDEKGNVILDICCIVG